MTLFPDLTLATNEDADEGEDESEDDDDDDEDEEQEEGEDDPFLAFKEAHIKAAKEKELMAKQKEKEKEKELPASKRQRRKGPTPQPPPAQETSAPASGAQTRPTLDIQNPGFGGFPQDHSTPLPGGGNMITMSEASLERMLTRIVGSFAPGQAQTSFVEAIEKQTESLTTAVKSNAAKQVEEVEKEPVVTDRSWWLVLDNHSVEDNSQNKLDWEIRNNLRAPNTEPKLYWAHVENKVTPVRGQSLYLSHINGGEGLHPMVVRLLHDRTCHISVK